jgi:hypothetical protein
MSNKEEGKKGLPITTIVDSDGKTIAYDIGESERAKKLADAVNEELPESKQVKVRIINLEAD